MNRFKRIVIVALLAIFTATSANAGFKFGIKAGMLVNKLSIDNATFDGKNRCGFTGGLTAEFQVPLIGLCFDASLMYSRMTAKITDPVPASGVIGEPTTDNKNCFQIPIHIKYKIGLPVVGSIITPYIYTGPDFAFRLGRDDESIVETKAFQCAWDLGLGVELLRHLQIGAGYSWGINNIAEKVIGVHTADNIKLRNNYWTITAAYLF